MIIVCKSHVFVENFHQCTKSMWVQALNAVVLDVISRHQLVYKESVGANEHCPHLPCLCHFSAP